MKIGICCYPSYGGSGVVATELGLELAEYGHEVHFITYDKPFRLGEYHKNVYFHSVDEPNYPVFQHPPYIMSLANRIYEVALREKLDVVHAHYAVPHSLAIHLAKEMSGGQFKTITTVHGTDVTIMGDDPSLKEISQFSILKSDVITAVSDDLLNMTEEMLAGQKKVSLIYNFVDTKIYQRKSTACVKECLKLKDSEKIIVHTSNFRKVKRIEDVMSIFKGVLEQVPQARLVLVGDGPEQRKAYELADKWGINEKVNFMGKQNSVVSILSCADLFLLPSEKESFGLAALEAMACQVPVVATRVGGIPEVVVDGENGYLSEVGDVVKMTLDCIRLLQNSALATEMASNSRKRAMAVFDSSIIIPQYIKLYESLLSTP